MSKNNQVEAGVMGKVLDKLEKIDTHLNNVDKTLIKQEANLEKHMLRTDQNELLINKIFDDVKPIRKHVNMMEGGLKLLGIMALVVSISAGLAKLFGVI